MGQRKKYVIGSSCGVSGVILLAGVTLSVLPEIVRAWAVVLNIWGAVFVVWGLMRRERLELDRLAVIMGGILAAEDDEREHRRHLRSV